MIGRPSIEQSDKSERAGAELSRITRGVFVLAMMFFALLLLRLKRQSQY
jgi:hypothetical protein